MQCSKLRSQAQRPEALLLSLSASCNDPWAVDFLSATASESGRSQATGGVDPFPREPAARFSYGTA